MACDRKFHKTPKIRAEIAQGIGAAARVLGAAALALVLFTGAAPADETPSAGHPLPRYASLREDLVYLRIGPGQQYKIRWELRRENLPVLIFGEYDIWRRVRLHDGEEGWIHRAMLRGRRYATARPGDAILRDKPGLDGERLARAKPALPLRLRVCEINWCEVEADGMSGWVQKTEIWGVEPTETFR